MRELLWEPLRASLEGVGRVFVRPDFRGRGVFGSLYRHIEAEARAQADPRVVGLRLYVLDRNESARAVYRKLGMAATGYGVLEVDFVLHPKPQA